MKYRQFQYQIKTEPIVVTGEAVTEDRWHQPWSEPVRFKVDKRLSIALIVSGATIDPFILTQPEQITEDRWHQPWSEPVRFKPRLREGLQQFISFYPTPLVSFGWDEPLSEPVRFRAFPTREQQFTAFLNPEPTVGSIEARWHFPWSEPVRIKPATPTPEQIYLEWVFSPKEIGLIGWFNPFSLPRTLEKQGLKNYLQQFLAYHPRILPNPTMTGTMSATERGDVFLAGGALFNQVTSAQVGIIEIFPRAATVGIIENAAISANVGQVGAIASAQSGTVISSSYAAIVSIRTV